MSGIGDSYWTDAFVLHSRPVRESSAIIELFTERSGFVKLIAKGIKRKKSVQTASLQAFQRIGVCWVGRSQTPILNGCELISRHDLRGRATMCGLYLNELLTRLLPPWDAHPSLFSTYGRALEKLATNADCEMALRYFELDLLNELGYLPNLEFDVGSGNAVSPDCCYRYFVDEGFVEGPPDDRAFSGETLIALRDQTLQGPDQLREAKRLMRSLINHLMGHRPLKSRELFRYSHFE